MRPVSAPNPVTPLRVALYVGIIGDRQLTPGVTGSPFGPDEPRRLRDAFTTWSYLIGRNRVWNPTVLPDSI